MADPRITRAEIHEIEYEQKNVGPDESHYEMALVHPKEMSPLMPSGMFKDYRDDLGALDARRHVPVPQGPGIGVEINWDMVKRLTISAQTFD